VTGEDAQSILTTLTGPLTTALTGARGSLTELSALVAGAAPGASSARAAADVALHDAWARDAELALVELLGGDADDHLESDMTISLEDPAVMATRAQQAAEAGYRVLKIKLGQDIGGAGAARRAGGAWMRSPRRGRRPGCGWRRTRAGSRAKRSRSSAPSRPTACQWIWSSSRSPPPIWPGWHRCGRRSRPRSWPTKRCGRQRTPTASSRPERRIC